MDAVEGAVVDNSQFPFIVDAGVWNGFVLFVPQYDEDVTSTWQFGAIDLDFGVDAISVESVDNDDVSLKRIFCCMNWLYCGNGVYKDI